MNPILKLLCKNRRYLREEHVAKILAAINAIGDSPFKLGDLDPYIPEELKSNSRARRSISSLLEELAKIGYLGKPSERKYQKRFSSLSHMLSGSLFELSELERKPLPQYKPEKIIRLNSKSQRPIRTLSKGAKNS